MAHDKIDEWISERFKGVQIFDLNWETFGSPVYDNWYIHCAYMFILQSVAMHVLNPTEYCKYIFLTFFGFCFTGKYGFRGACT